MTRTTTRTLLPLWLTVWLPFATLPWFTIARNHAHVPFHLVYIPLIVAAMWLSRSFAVNAVTRLQSGLALLLGVAESIALAGHVVELIATVRTWIDDGYAATNGEWIFDHDHLHVGAANTAVPALMAGLVLLLALTVAAYVQAGRPRLTGV